MLPQKQAAHRFESAIELSIGWTAYPVHVYQLL